MPNPETKEQAFAPIIPARVVIAVTGHRDLSNGATLARQINYTLDRVKQMIPKLRNTPVVLTILSSLAEGADRLVAREVLKMPGAELEAVLPLEKTDYISDFESPESQKEFEEFLSQARRVRQVPSRGDRREAYASAGRYIVDQCDILLALWDSKPAGGYGGTAEVVEYARQKRCPLFVINTEDAEVIEEVGSGLDPRPFDDLERYNAEKIDSEEIKKRAAEKSRFLEAEAKAAQFPIGRLRTISDHLLPQYARADRLAVRYHNLYLKAGTLVYALAAAAVTVAAFQALFLPDWPRIVTIEVLLIIIVLTIPFVGSRRQWHGKWLDFRFLAERFRSALFMALARLNVTALRPPRHLSLSYSSNDWMVPAFSSVWNQLPQLDGTNPSEFEGLKKFLLAAWIEDQIRFHGETSERHYRKHHRLVVTTNILFAITFVAAVFHALGLGPHSFHTTLAFIAIVSPAVGAALGAIRMHREYLRNAKRSTEMVRHLEELKGKMQEARDMVSLLPLVREAEETMLHENEDWRVVVRFHELELPA